MSCLSPFYRSALGVGYMHRIYYYLARWLGAVLGCFFFGGKCSIFTLPFFFRGRCSPSHTHTHKQNSREFFPRHPFNFWRISPKTHLWDELCNFIGVFHFRFFLTVPIIFQENIFKHFGSPPSRSQNAIRFMSRTPQIFYKIQFHIIIFA